MNLMSKALRITFLLFVFFFITNNNAVVYGQSGATTATIAGVVTDEQGGVISGVTIVVKNTATNLTRQITTNEEGAYELRELPPGIYELSSEAEGFKIINTKLELGLGTVTTLNLPLKVAGGTNEVIEITANNFVNQGKTESSNNVDRGRIDNLPINRRNFLDFSLTTPRATQDRAPAAEGIVNSSGLSFNGQSARLNNVTIDGFDNNNAFSGSVRTTFSQDAVQEFQVVSDSFSAEFGRALGGVVNIVTRGGGNDFHGRFFIINRNDKISARDVFAPFKPPFSQTQSGITLSGPLKKDKAFFFTSFERLSVKQNNFVTISDDTIAAINRQRIPLRNGPIPFSNTVSTFLGRADIALSSNDTLTVRYNYSGIYDGRFEPFGGLVGDSATTLQRTNDNSISINNIYVNPGANLANETRFLFSRRILDTVLPGQGPRVQIVAPEGDVMFGRSPTGGPFKDLSENVYQIVNNVTLTRGKNVLKFGADYTFRDVEGGFVGFGGGLTIFVPIDFAAITGNPTAPFLTALQAFDPNLRTPAQIGFLTGLSAVAPMVFPGFPANVPLANLSLPITHLQGFGDGTIDPTAKNFSLFVQDDIKISPKLLLKAGLRYDINRVKFLPTNNGNFSPRLALSYQVAEKVNLHASYGLFYGIQFLGLNFPTQPSISGNVKTAQYPFPFSSLVFAQPGNTFPDSRDLPAGLPFIPQLSFSFEYEPNLRTPYSQQVNTGIDYFLNNNTLFSVNYSFVRGIRLFAERYVNNVVRPTNNPVESAIIGRIDPTRGQVSQFATASDSYYHSVTFAVNRRLANNFSLLAHYTLSKAIDNSTDIRLDVVDGPVDGLNLRAERGLSFQDARHRFVASGVWNLNYSKNILLRDFQLSSIITLESGRPYNLKAGVDLDRNGDIPAFDRPAFLGRNVGVQPGFARVDMRLTRSISFKERFKFQAFFEAFNLFNRVNISTFDRTFPPDQRGNFNLPPNTGQNGRFIVTPDRFRGAFSPRQLQAGLRIEF